MLQSHLKVEQCACIHAVVERRDIADELHVHDKTPFGTVGVAQDLEWEGCLGNLRSIRWYRLVACNVRGSIGGGTAGGWVLGGSRCDRCDAAGLCDGDRANTGTGGTGRGTTLS